MSKLGKRLIVAARQGRAIARGEATTDFKVHFVLEPDEYDAFVKLLDNPPPPSEKLKAFMRKKPLWEK